MFSKSSDARTGGLPRRLLVLGFALVAIGVAGCGQPPARGRRHPRANPRRRPRRPPNRPRTASPRANTRVTATATTTANRATATATSSAASRAERPVWASRPRRALRGAPLGLLAVCVLVAIVVLAPVGVTIEQALQGGTSAALRSIDASSARTLLLHSVLVAAVASPLAGLLGRHRRVVHRAHRPARAAAVDAAGGGAADDAAVRDQLCVGVDRHADRRASSGRRASSPSPTTRSCSCSWRARCGAWTRRSRRRPARWA